MINLMWNKDLKDYRKPRFPRANKSTTIAISLDASNLKFAIKCAQTNPQNQ